MRELKISNLVARPGEKVSGFVPIIGADFGIPVTIICGVEEGETVLISGGLHNAEYVGIQAAMELADTLDPQKIRGNVVVIRLMNRTGFEHRTMSLVYEDGKNLNRIFPGAALGSLGDKIAYTIETEFFSKADYYIDLHCGDGFESLASHVYVQGAAAPEVNEKSRALGDIAHVDFLYVSKNTRGGAYSYAGTLGIPGILLERGSNSIWCQEQVAEDVHDVKNMLRYLGVLIGKSHCHAKKPVQVNPGTWEDAPVSGCWYPTRQAGESFKKGEVLGTIKDYFGKELHVCTAKHDGVMLYQTISLCIQEGEPMVAYGTWDEETQGVLRKECIACGSEHESHSHSHGHEHHGHHGHTHTHSHEHAHEDGTVHSHEHTHGE